jgi:predicted HicB family RNase H-like nuclease
MASTEKRQQTAISYVRVKPEIKAMLAAQAAAQGRSMANYLEYLIQRQAQQKRQPLPAGAQ